MKSQYLTDLINRRLNTLKVGINSAPPGGDFNTLREFLKKIRYSIAEFETMLDEIEMEEI